ncbi:MAG: hypothetical protein LBH17_07700 [Oscillospiraceae bacterium]|nr:hypothetical protein [Oscillospiraceae bacterium]
MKKLISVLLAVSLLTAVVIYAAALKEPTPPPEQAASEQTPEEAFEASGFDIHDTTTVYEYPEMPYSPSGEYEHPITIDVVVYDDLTWDSNPGAST